MALFAERLWLLRERYYDRRAQFRTRALGEVLAGDDVRTRLASMEEGALAGALHRRLLDWEGEPDNLIASPFLDFSESPAQKLSLDDIDLRGKKFFYAATQSLLQQHERNTT
jgi:hypothetical protein